MIIFSIDSADANIAADNCRYGWYTIANRYWYDWVPYLLKLMTLYYLKKNEYENIFSSFLSS